MLQPMLRHAVPGDIDDLVEIEVDAGRLFHLVDMPEVAADIPDRDELARIQAQGRIWVAADDDHCAAYIVASTVDGHAHIDQVSVRPSAPLRCAGGCRLPGHRHSRTRDRTTARRTR